MVIDLQYSNSVYHVRQHGSCMKQKKTRPEFNNMISCVLGQYATTELTHIALYSYGLTSLEENITNT